MQEQLNNLVGLVCRLDPDRKTGLQDAVDAAIEAVALKFMDLMGEHLDWHCNRCGTVFPMEHPEKNFMKACPSPSCVGSGQISSPNIRTLDAMRAIDPLADEHVVVMGPSPAEVIGDAERIRGTMTVFKPETSDDPDIKLTTPVEGCPVPEEAMLPCKLCGAMPITEKYNVAVFHADNDCRMVTYLHEDGVYYWDWQELMGGSS